MKKQLIIIICTIVITAVVLVPVTINYAVNRSKQPKVVMLTEDSAGKKYVEEEDWYGHTKIEISNDNASKVQITDSGYIAVYDDDYNQLGVYGGRDHLIPFGTIEIPYEKKQVEVNIPIGEDGEQILQEASVTSMCKYTTDGTGYTAQIRSNNKILDADLQREC